MEVSYNEIDIQEFRTFLQLQKEESIRILSRAINRTLPGVRTDAVQEVYNVLALTKTTIRKYMRVVKRASPSDASAVFEIKSYPIPLIHYQATKVKRGVSVRVLRGTPKSIIRHAFIATMPSGHTGVFWREENIRGSKWPVGITRTIPSWSDYPHREIRLPIRQLFGLAVPDVLDHGTHMEVVMAKVGDRYEKNLDHEYSYWLSQQAGLFD